MANPYLIQMGSPLTGAMNMFMGARDRAQQAQRQRAIDAAAPAAMMGDQAAIQQLAASDPQLAMQMQQMQRQQAQQQAEQKAAAAKAQQELVQKFGDDFSTRMAELSKIKPENQQAYIDQMERELDAKFGDQAGPLLEQFIGTHPDAKQQLIDVYGAMESTPDSKLPADVFSTLWLQKQPQETQDLFFKIKRQEQLTPEEKLEYEQALKDLELASERRRKKLESYDAQITAGIEAVDAIPSLKNSIDILKRVNTGGLEAMKLDAANFLGIESDQITDLNDLRAMLGQNVLTNIKALGANPTEGERDFIQSISASITQGKAITHRQLTRLLREAQRQRERAIKAYNFSLEENPEFADPFAAELLGIPISKEQPAAAPAAEPKQYTVPTMLERREVVFPDKPVEELTIDDVMLPFVGG